MPYRAVFAVVEFRYVFVAHLLSTLGTVLCEIGLSVLVYRMTGSPLLSALTFALGLLPYLIGGTALAAVADRYPARRVLVACDLLCALAAAGLTAPGMPVPALLVLRCLIAVIAPVFTGTRMASLGEILGAGDGFVLGRSALRLVSQLAQLTGFAAGGLLLAVLAPRAVLGVTAVTFLCSALLLRRGTRARAARAPTGGTALFASLRGAREVWADRRVRALLTYAWVPPMFVVFSEALMTPYAAARHAGSAALGLLMCGMPIGAITAEALVGAFVSPRGRAALSRPVAIWAVLPALAYAFDPPLPVALACQVLTGVGICYGLGLDQWFLAAVPERLRGTAMTLLTAGLMTAQGLGMTIAGTLAEVLPIHLAIAAGGLLGLLCVTATLLHLGTTAGTIGTKITPAGGVSESDTEDLVNNLATVEPMPRVGSRPATATGS